MNFYAIDFGGFTKEVRALNDQQAVASGRSVLRRWNQPRCTVYRTNPFNSTFKKEVGTVINENYDPEQPSLTEDPLHLYLSEEPKKKKRKRSTRKGGSQTTTAPRKKFKVPLRAIAEKLETDPAALRRKLRKSDIEKPAGGWGWDSWDDPAVQEILTWKEAK